MSRKSSVVKAVLTVESKSITEQMDGVRHAIETGVVDAHTIATLKRLLTSKSPPATSVTITNTKYTTLTATKSKRRIKTTEKITPAVAPEPFPSADLVSATKTIVMKCLTTLATEAESRAKIAEVNKISEPKTTKQPVSQGTRNVITCCKLALETLRELQDHKDIGSTWVNKAYFGYISKIIALEMSETATKELSSFKTEIEKQLRVDSNIHRRLAGASRKGTQSLTKQNLSNTSTLPFDPLALMCIAGQEIDNEELILLGSNTHIKLIKYINSVPVLTQSFIIALDAKGGPIQWINRLPPEKASQQIDNFSRALIKIALNSTSPQIQLSIRTLRHRLALTQTSTNIDAIAKSTYQALRSYYAATKSEKEAYGVCKDTLSTILDQIVPSGEIGRTINFMGLLARKAGLLVDAMRWNDLGLRKCPTEDKCSNALFVLRNAAIIFSLPVEELGIVLHDPTHSDMTDETIQERLRHAQNCLNRFDEFASSDLEQLRDELDYLRRALISCRPEIIESKQCLREARELLPRKLLRAVSILAEQNPPIIPKLVIPARTLIFDLLTTLRKDFSPQSPPHSYLAILDICQNAALKVQDNQALQFTGNQYFNCGNVLFKAGKRKDAKRVLEKSLELDFSPLPDSQTEGSEQDERKISMARCRKLEMLGECCGKGEEKDAFALILEALNVHLSTLSLENDAATLSLAQVMKKEEYLTRLVGSLTRFTIDQLVWSPGMDAPRVDDEYSIILNESLPVVVKALVSEIQILVFSSMTHQGQHEMARKICHQVLEIYTENDFPLRRIRVIERLLYLAVVDGNKGGGVLDLGGNVITILASTKVFGKDNELGFCRKALLTRCLVWIALLSDNTDDPKTEYFSQALAIWTRWSEKVVHDSKEEDEQEIVEVTRILDLISDFFEFKSLSLLRLQSLHLLLKLQSHLTKNVDIIIRIYASLALQYLRLGYTGKAGVLFAHSLKKMKDAEPSTTTQILWHLHYAEYFARVGIFAKAKLHVSQAGEIYTRHFNSPKKRIDVTERTERLLAVARAGYVLSLISFEENELEKAIGYIDYAIRVLKTGITTVERTERTIKPAFRDFDPFSSDSRPKVEEPENKPIQFGSKLWTFKIAFFMAVVQHGVLLTFRGSPRDGEFWFRQAYDIAKSINSPNAILIATLHLGDLFTRMSSMSNAHEFLSEAAKLADGVERTSDSITMELYFANIHGRKELWNDAFRSILRAENKLRKLLDPEFVNRLEKGEVIDLVDRFTNMRLSVGASTRAASAASPKGSRRQANHSSIVSRVEYESVTFSKMQTTIAETKGYSLARQRRFEEGYLAMDSIRDKDRISRESLSSQITRVHILLLEVHQLLGSDPLLCVLSESAISIPNVHGKKTKASVTLTRGKRARTRSAQLSHSVSRFQALRLEAQETIESIFEHACQLCPSTLAQVVGILASEARLLSSVINEPETDQNILALKTIMLLDRSKSVMYRREQAMLDYEAKQEYISLKEIQWPTHDSSSDFPDEDLTDMLQNLAVSRKQYQAFTAETLLQGLPTGCTVVSIHLSETKEHFILSKVQSQGCVVVRLPLLKHPPDADEKPFTFDYAYSELSEIIKLNNESTRAAKDVPDRQAKELWWANRKELDARLALFLQNMENCWIGGFTGMFRGFFPNDDVFTKFRLAFRQILIKFLPSRKEGDSHLELDPRLIDLFLDLKSAKPEFDSDVADQVEDLICFVLDNFKFHGEQIAIDEMTIDIQEAIRSYHEATTPPKQDHVILILDKALHRFPWESIPCLRGRPVSRLPSLGSLMERIVNSPIEGAQWPYVAPDRGFFILNPEKDLTHTQSQFENTLSRLDGWSGIVGRAPMDQEILSALRNKDIFLYFGHGSAEQYVKSSQIKRLQNSAVAMLFGCSSGKLHEAGDFEPWGTPFTYLLAGRFVPRGRFNHSPAMLANLWDVTDRDIDRLSYGVFTRWGLCEERPKSRSSDDQPFEIEKEVGMDFGGVSISERKKKFEASIKGKKSGFIKPGVSLTEALAAAREDCTLKYLNGAAPVIYGVPVFLEKRK